jgi:transposase
MRRREKRRSLEFEVLPKRWVVERSFGWMNQYRRLSKDYEVQVENSDRDDLWSIYPFDGAMIGGLIFTL